MKQIIVILSFLLVTGAAYAEEFRAFDVPEEHRGQFGRYHLTNQKENGFKNDIKSSEGRESCEVVKIYTYRRTMRIVPSAGYLFPNRTIGSSPAKRIKETCMTITIQNKDHSVGKYLQINRDIKVTTAKGNTVSPVNDHLEYFEPGQSLRISDVCFGKLLSPIDEIQLDCY